MGVFLFHRMQTRVLPVFFMLLFTILSGCAGTEAPQFSGSWKSVNAFDTSIRAIALTREAVFYATPMDATLRGLLSRWARESGKQLDYRHDYDYTLPVGLAALKAPSIKEAVEKLQQTYAEKAIFIAVDEYGHSIVVEGQALAESGNKKKSSKVTQSSPLAASAKSSVRMNTQKHF